MLYLTHYTQRKGETRKSEHEAGRALLLHALKEEYGFSSLPQIGRGEHKKPYFPDHSGIYFNISHSGGLAVCALSDRETGVDIEHIRRVGEGLLRRVLSEGEREWLSAQKEREEAFIRLWTLKESYIKATGDGLSAELSSVEFTLPDSYKEAIRCSKEGYSFYQQKIGKNMYLAVCERGQAVSPCMKKLHIVF